VRHRSVGTSIKKKRGELEIFGDRTRIIHTDVAQQGRWNESSGTGETTAKPSGVTCWSRVGTKRVGKVHYREH